jgi:hypothetical protein
MSMPHEAAFLNPELQANFAQLQTLVQQAAHDGTAVHDVERALWEQILRIGRLSLQQFFTLVGSGDVGDTLTLPDGQVQQRLPELHERRYVSIFGHFTLARTVYGSREGQQIVCVPLDNRLQLPASAYSYVLQDWDQSLCAEQAFSQASSTVARMLQLKQAVDSLEHMNVHMAAQVQSYRENRPMPRPEQEGALLVVSGDGKGIVMRRSAQAPAPSPHRTKGAKANQKRMATVGAVYSVDRYVRTPEQTLAALFRDEPKAALARPQPQHKHVWASLEGWDEVTAQPCSSMDIVYPWLLNEVVERNKGLVKEMVYLHDGQEALWEAATRHLPRQNATWVLDVMHMTPRLWQAAHVFHGEGSDAAEAFVRARLLRVLRGQAAGVIRGLRQMGTKHELRGNRQKTLATVCNYLEKNVARMRYDEYLAKGYPIASGVIEGACRHLVKDRMERAGMHWTMAGAQAMLDVRSVHINGDWEAYQAYRIEGETKRLYPHRSLFQGAGFHMAA